MSMGFWFIIHPRGMGVLRPNDGETFDATFLKGLDRFYNFPDKPWRHVINGQFRKITISTRSTWDLHKKHPNMMIWRGYYVYIDTDIKSKALVPFPNEVMTAHDPVNYSVYPGEIHKDYYYHTSLKNKYSVYDEFY